VSAVFEFDAAEAEAAARRAATAPIWSNGRRPAFWGDLEVRAFLTALHRQATVADVLAACARRFGAARTPSKSALARYWLRLDEAAAGERRG
jgi:hypothetical protein